MEKQRWNRVKEIFNHALDLDSEKRLPYIQEACNGDEELVQDVRNLLSADESMEPGQTHQQVLGLNPNPSLPEQIGPFRIIKHLGSGGMGDVYLAEQREPVIRKVALKLVNRFSTSRDLINRFEGERQTLSMMNHPCIARFYEANISGNQPWFAMEFIDGKPITKVCNDRKYDLKKRLNLFLQVCSGIQHAHQRGIIHRDIKPGNILLAENPDDAPPKIIDFGISLALTDGQTIQERLTQNGVMIGTPAYMSPEQAQGLPDIDTRADVYALGVLLYELTVGVLPFSFEDTSIFEALHQILHQVPPHPTKRLKNLNEETCESLSLLCGMTTAQHIKTLRGDLTWILDKALRKDRELRYASVADLMSDVQAFLEDRPVSAGPPRVSYLAGKWIKRHRNVFVAGLIALLAIVSGSIASSVGYYRAVRAEHHAVLEAEKSKSVNEFLQSMLRSADPTEDGRNVKVIDVLVQAEKSLSEEPPSSLEVELSIANTLANTYSQLGLFDRAEAVARRSLKKAAGHYGWDHPQTAISQSTLGEILTGQWRLDEALTYLEPATETLLKTLGPADPATRDSMSALAGAYNDSGDNDKALPLIEDVYKQELRESGPNTKSTLGFKANLARCLVDMGKDARARKIYSETLKSCKQILGEDHVLTLHVLNEFAILILNTDPEKAIEMEQNVFKLAEKHLGTKDQLTITVLHNLGYFNEVNNEPLKAVPLYRQALKYQAAAWGENSLELSHTEVYLYRSLYKTHQTEAMNEMMLNRLGKETPLDPELWAAQSMYFLLLNDVTCSRKALSLGRKSAPDDLRWALIEGSILARTDEELHADKLFESILGGQPNPGELSHYLNIFSDIIPREWESKLKKYVSDSNK